MAVTQVGTPSTVVQTTGNAGSVTGAWSGTQPRTADHYLVAVVTAYGTTGSATIAESTGNWAQLEDLTAGPGCQTSMWGLFAAGGDAAPTFTATETGATGSARMTRYLIELAGVDYNNTAPATGSITGTTSPLTDTTGETVPSAGCYAISAWNVVTASSAAVTWTPGTSWSNVSQTGTTTTAVDHSFVDVYANPPSGSTLLEIDTHAVASTLMCGVIVVFQPLTIPVQPIASISDNFSANTENPAHRNTAATPTAWCSRAARSSPPLPRPRPCTARSRRSARTT